MPTPSDARFAFLHDRDLYDLVGRLTLKIVRDETFAEDIRQGAYIVAMCLVRAGRGPRPGIERGWMCRVARNRTYAELRARKEQEPLLDGDDTPDVKVLAHDVFPPAVPSGLQAAFSGPGQEAFIDLIWAPDTDADLNGYNVYRHEEGAAPVKVNAELVKTPAYRDAAVRPGKHYFYSVSAVDLRGNESARSEETSESVP